MRLLVLIALALATLGIAGASAAQTGKSFPETIPLPNGFQPEGIAIGPGHTFYVGSIPTGRIYRGSLQTGQGAVLVPRREGRQAIGVDVDNHGRLFVAGGATGHGYVYDARTGAPLADYTFTAGSTFVNDVVVTRTAAWFTDSFRPFLYRVAIGPGGRLATSATAVPLSGDIVYGSGFNANGIDATPDGKTLVIVQSNTGKLFTVDPSSGRTREIDLGGASVTSGDGILLDGKTLYVVRNRENRIAVVALSPGLETGRIIGHITDPDLDVPTTIDEFGASLYAVNARFGTPPTPETEYDVVRLPKR